MKNKQLLNIQLLPISVQADKYLTRFNTKATKSTYSIHQIKCAMHISSLVFCNLV
jgi:hypothetical protein